MSSFGFRTNHKIYCIESILEKEKTCVSFCVLFDCLLINNVMWFTFYLDKSYVHIYIYIHTFLFTYIYMLYDAWFGFFNCVGVFHVRRVWRWFALNGLLVGFLAESCPWWIGALNGVIYVSAPTELLLASWYLLIGDVQSKCRNIKLL